MFLMKIEIIRIHRKNYKIQFFYRIFIKKFQNFHITSQNFVFFVQTRKNLTHNLLPNLKNIKNNAIFAICLRDCFKISEKFFQHFQ